MIEYVHIPCKTVVATYCNEKPIIGPEVIRSKDWLIDGVHPAYGAISTFKCIGCGLKLGINLLFIEPKKAAALAA